MATPNWRETLVAYICAQARPVDKFSHMPRLYHLASQIAWGQNCDDEVLFAAAWLHDLGVFVGHRPEDPVALAQWDHVPYTVEKSGCVLRELGFPVEKIPAVQEAIRTHQPKDNPSSAEAIVLRDADILEQLGAIIVLRTVAKVGRDSRFATFADALQVLQRNLDRLPGQLRLETSRQMAAARLASLRAFLLAAQAEADGQPF